MTCRDRADAYAAVLKFTSSFDEDGSRLLPTKDLHSKLQQNEKVILVDVRMPEEQKVSMIPGAVTKEIFEVEILPNLVDEANTAKETCPLVVPYCTVGYRSGMYCRELTRTHKLDKQNVMNGEGVIMWTFDAGALARPLSGASAGRAPSLQEVSRTEDGLVQSFGAGDADCRSPIECREVHVYGKTWDFAAEGFHTVYFSNAGGARRFLASKCKAKPVATASLWFGTLLVWYLGLVPMCGVMFGCGCHLAFTKITQVAPCNIFDNVKLKCPWCTCSGLPCILVGSDSVAWKNVPIFDTTPDGFFITIVTVVVIHQLWRRIDRRMSGKSTQLWTLVLTKATVTVVWFFVYSLVVGLLFFLCSSDYPVFFSEVRTVEAPLNLTAGAMAPRTVAQNSHGGSGLTPVAPVAPVADDQHGGSGR